MLLYKCQSGPDLHFTPTAERAARASELFLFFFTLGKKQRCDRSILLNVMRPSFTLLLFHVSEWLGNTDK